MSGATHDADQRRFRLLIEGGGQLPRNGAAPNRPQGAGAVPSGEGIRGNNGKGFRPHFLGSSKVGRESVATLSVDVTDNE